MATVSRCILILICAIYVKSDDIDRGARKGVMLKLLREMVNQTKADTLTLPANATSIRENITDTFSCEDRMYGYYADVDNDCQVFHVCLTSQGASGRNVTYRWSFICPAETIFNQEVLTCTRPRDSIDCEDAPMYYDVNMDIGKVNDTQQADNNKDKENKSPNKINTNSNKANKDKRKQPNRKKQNIIMENMLKEVNTALSKEDLEDEEIPVVIEEMENKPIIHKIGEAYDMTREDKENVRLAAERSLKRKGRKISRGTFRFKADV